MKYLIQLTQKIIIILAIITAFMPYAQAQKIERIYPTSPGAAYTDGHGIGFGFSVSIFENYALMTARWANKIFAYKYNGTSWDQIQVLTYPLSKDPLEEPTGVDIDGQYAVIGRADYKKDSMHNYGAVSIYKRVGDSWSLKTTVMPSDLEGNSYFGEDVAISGDYFVAGASSKECAYVYKRSNESWNLVKKLTPSGASGDQFGRRVAISDSGDYIIVGARFHDNDEVDSGCAYIYLNSNDSWSQVSKILPDDPARNACFGSDVAIYSNYAIVGAEHAIDANGINIGAVYVFKRNNATWTQIQKITRSFNQVNVLFGQSISLSGDKIAVAAPGLDSIMTQDAGAVFVYQLNNDTFIPISQYYPTLFLDGYNRFGYDLDLHGNDLIIGNGGASIDEYLSGEAYICKISTPHLDVSDMNSYQSPVSMTITSETDSNVTVFIESENQSILPDTNIDISNSGSNNFVIDTQANIPVSFDTVFTPMADEYGIVTLTATVSDTSGNSNQYLFRLNCYMNLTPDIIHSPTGNNVHDFGSSVAVDGQTVLVGCSQYTSVDGARVGRTFFYEYNSKNGEFSDFSDDGSTSGGTVTLSGSLGMSKALGKVSFNYFQKVNGRWELTQTYRENTSGYYFKTGCSPSGFGASNSMSDHYFIAGYNTAGGTYVSTYECQNGPGKAFIYKYNGSIWEEQTSFTGNDSINEDYFGNNVDMHKEYAVITAPGHASGAVYVFKRNNESWSQQQKIVADANITYFGAFAAIHNNYIVTSGVNEDGNLRDKTAYQPHIYIYKRDDTTWQLSQKFFIPTRYDSQYITGACDISDQYLAIFLHTKTFLYKRIGDNWKLADILDKGYSIAISDDLLVTGDNNTTASVYPLSSRPRISIETTEISVANPVRFSITTAKNTRITLEAVSKNESIVPSGGIDINKSGQNVFQLNTTANEPAQFTLWITPGWTLFADVPIVLTATDLDGQSATTTLTCYSPTAATEVKLNHPQGSAGFGRDIGVGNDFLVVASADKSLLYYEFDGESWIYKQKISSIGNGANESQIHVDGNDIVIGERYYNSYAGRVVILTKEGSSFQQSYINPPAELLNNPSLQFGSQLDINNGYLVVGVSKYMSSNYIYYGAVYVYKKDNSWNPVHTIVGEIDNKKLGQYVAISGDHIITVSDDYTYFFKRDGDSWNQVNQFPKDPDRNFKAVEINGNFAAVSMSPANQDLKPVLYMFQYKDNTWTPSQTITYHELNYRERKSSNGYSVSMSGNYMACSFLSDAGDLEKPYVFLYRRSEDQWILVSRIYSEKSFKLNKRDLYYNSDTFGNAIALSGTTLLVAEKDEACQNMVDENRCGAVYVYRDEQFAITYKKIDVLSDETIQLWLSAQDINNTNHGDPIALWEDHSSVNNYLIQSESTARPTFVSNAIHGYPSVKFDGISQFLQGRPISGQTIFAVLRLDADATPGATLMSDINNPEYDNIAIETPGTWATGGDSNFSKGTLFVNGAQTSAYESGKFHILSLQSAGQRDFEFELGKSQNNTFFKGDIAELIVYKDKLDTFARKQIESSLANTYGITIVDDIYAGDSLDKGQYIQNIAYIGKTSDVLNTAAGSRGLTLGNQFFLQDNGDYIMFGHNIDVNALTGENLPSEVKRRWSRSWYLDMDDVNANGGTVSFHFNYVASGLISPIGVHALIYRSTRNDAFEVLQTKLVLAGDETVFDVDISTLSDGYYTLGFIFENDEYVMDITGIGKDAEGTRSIAESAGLTVENISFLQNNGDFMCFGHKTTVNEIVVSDLPQSIEARWSRSWFIDFTDENTQGGDLKFTFNYSNGNFPETPTGVHALIKRSNENSSFEIVATQLILSGTETAFTVNVNDLGDGFYTLGLVKNFAAENGDHVLDFTGIYRIDPFLITANQSAGLIIENKSYLYDNWDYVVWGHNTPEITLYNKNLPPSIGYRWNRDWFIHFDDTNANGGDITIKFDFMGVGFGEPFDAEYFLIHRDQANDTFEKIDATPVVTDRSVDFVCDVSNLTDGYYCIGMNLLLEIEDLTGTPAGLPVSETANQLSLWLKPEKLTRQSAGTPTQIWADASVHENNLTQEIKTSQPLYTPNVINGQPALYFDGTNDYMDTLNDALSARTVFAVLKIDEDAPYLSCLLTETDKDENNIRTNVPVSVWRATQHYADLNDFSYKGFAAVNGADTDLHDNQYHVLTQMSASQKDFHLRISQVLQARYFKGYLSELVIFENPLNKAQRRIMENYLSAKYNISIVGDRYQGDDIHSGNYDLDVSGIGKDYDGHSTTGQSGGLIIQDIDFLHPFHWLSLLQISI